MHAGSGLAIERRGACAVLRLDRPEALNALTYPMLGAMRDAVEAAVRDDEIAAIVVTGSGRGFCAGIDMQILQDSAAGTARHDGPGASREGDPPALFGYLTRVPKPVIAAVNGVAAGGGFVLAMMCDLRFAAEEASFTTIFSRRALVAEHGTSWLLPRQVGTSRALDLLWTSRKVAAAEALRIGLVDRVVAGDAVDAVVAYVEELRATVPPRTIALMKRQVYDHLQTDFDAAMRESQQLMEAALAHPDATEGARAFVERRTPVFRPLGTFPA